MGKIIDTNKYGVYSEFDVERHKQTFHGYLEVVIEQNGHISYAVPSHMIRLINITADLLNLDYETVMNMAREDTSSVDYGLKWLCRKSGAIAVWDTHIIAAHVTVAQMKALCMLQEHGLYHGTIPTPTEYKAIIDLPRHATIILFNEKKDQVLTQWKNTQIDFITSAIDDDECTDAAAYRILREKTGINGINVDLQHLMTQATIHNTKNEKDSCYYIYTGILKTSMLPDTDDQDDGLKWWNIHEYLPHMMNILSKTTYVWLKNAMDKHGIK